MDKEFLKYNQQMRYLRGKKNIGCDGTTDKIILCRSGYFNLINGYKEPFVSRMNGDDHIYIKGTTIKQLYQVKKFDDELRMHLLKYITMVEEEVRTLVGYKFDEINNQGKIEWYSVNAYGDSNNAQQIVKVISDSFQEVHRSQQAYIQHYLDKHKYVPTWIMIKVIKFSTFIDFIECSKKEVKDSICDLYQIKNASGKNDYKTLIGSLHWLRKTRNSCAHNERIYGIHRSDGRINTLYHKLLPKSYTRERDQKLIDLIIYMRYYLSDRDYKKFISEIIDLLKELESNINSHSYNKVRADIGIKNIQDLEVLVTNKKKIEYNKF
ncbi:MAG: Abi family protein [Clostridiaceae bacterium]